MNKTGICAAAVLLSLLVAACGGGSGSEPVLPPLKLVPFAPTADDDAFYAQPVPMPRLKAGTILDSREVRFAPALGVPIPLNRAWQLKYMSADSHGRPIAAVATVVKPLLPLTGQPVLMSYQSAANSLGLGCAPSHTLTGSTANANSQLEALAFLPGLEALGWTFVFPDHAGPTSAYGAGELAGHITLDGIRAALQFPDAGLSPDTKVGMWGYSGGALATAWAATLQESYAPELNIVGVASGGTPADLKGAVQNFNGRGIANIAFFSLGLSAITGVNREYPEVLDGIVNDKGRAAINSIKDGCVGDTTDGSPKPGGHFEDYVTVPDPITAPGALKTFPKINLPQPGRTPIAEMYVYHSILDELIPVAGTTAMVESWCADGAKVHYRRSLLGEHVAYVALGAPEALLFLESRFTGLLQPVLPLATVSCN